MEIRRSARPTSAVPDIEPRYVFRPRHHAGDRRGVANKQAGDGPGYHGRAVDPYRAGRGAAQLAEVRITSRAYQPHRLVGRDAIVLKDGQQVPEFREGLLPWALHIRSP